MKKLICVMLTVLMTLSLFAGCGAQADDGIYKVAIVQQLDHSSLDEIRVAIEAELDKIAAEDGVKVEYKHFNGQNDTSILAQIGTQVVSEAMTSSSPSPPWPPSIPSPPPRAPISPSSTPPFPTPWAQA